MLVYPDTSSLLPWGLAISLDYNFMVENIGRIYWTVSKCVTCYLYPNEGNCCNHAVTAWQTSCCYHHCCFLPMCPSGSGAGCVKPLLWSHLGDGKTAAYPSQCFTVAVKLRKRLCFMCGFCCSRGWWNLDLSLVIVLVATHVAAAELHCFCNTRLFFGFCENKKKMMGRTCLRQVFRVF